MMKSDYSQLIAPIPMVLEVPEDRRLTSSSVVYHIPTATDVADIVLDEEVLNDNGIV